MEEDMIADAIFELGIMITYFQNDFYSNNNFKVNANGTADLSKSQYIMLMALRYSNMKSLTELAELLHSSHSNLSILMSKLAENGYIRKEYPGHKEDKRKIYFYITPKGEEKVCEITEKIENDILQFFERLDEKQRRLLKEGINYFLQIDTETIGEPLLPTDTEKSAENDRAFASRLSRMLLRFFNWKACQFTKDFKVNGNNGRLLTDRQFAVLFCIQKLNYNTISKLEKVLPVEGSTVSNAVSKLVRDGFLIRERPDCGDGRIVYFAITEKGEQTLQQAADNIRLYIKEYLKMLSAVQRQNLISGMAALHELFNSLQKNLLINRRQKHVF